MLNRMETNFLLDRKESFIVNKVKVKIRNVCYTFFTSN